MVNSRSGYLVLHRSWSDGILTINIGLIKESRSFGTFLVHDLLLIAATQRSR
jgi:hypothetical protein